MSEKIHYNLIYLTGFMGSGKSTIGPILANTLGFSFVDIDNEIINSAGKPIKEIFKDSGEQYFRDMEHEILKEVSKRKKTVVSLGGGTITFERNREIIKSTGILVYLQSELGYLYKRLKWKRDRPLLINTEDNSSDTDQLRRSIETLIKIREPYYNQAEIKITTSGKKIGTTVDELVSLLKPYLKIFQIKLKDGW